MNDGLPTDMLVNAQIRIAAKEGVPITVLRHGYDSSGTIILKINRLDGTAQVLSQTRYDDELVWIPASKTDAFSETEADAYIEKQIRIDPDSWVLEIEDRQGRHWFPGRILRL